MAIDTTYGTNTALTVTNLHSIVDDAYWQSAAIDNGTVKAQWMELFITILTTTSAGDANGTINIYVANSTDGGTDFAGGASGSEGSYTDTANVDPKQLLLAGVMPCDASETTARTYKYHLRVYDLSEDFSIVLRNASGQSLGGSTNSVEYRLNKYTST